MEKVNRNSQNSSILPSTELIKPDQKKPAKKKKRKRGGQSGHVGHSRELYPNFPFIKTPQPIYLKDCSQNR